MLPVQALFNKFIDLVAADVGSLAPAINPNKIALVTAPFTPSKALVLADLTLATFTGSTPLAGVAGTQPTGNDPSTSDRVADISPPAGGWRWQCTVAPAPAQTVYGFALCDNGVANLLATAVLPSPVVIGNVGDFIDLADLPRFTLLNSSVS